MRISWFCTFCKVYANLKKFNSDTRISKLVHFKIKNYTFFPPLQKKYTHILLIDTKFIDPYDCLRVKLFFISYL